ncbi:hypothetical protein IJ102_00500 [Candidatus Saccharibacteria bacterium]|nr:hypothetical protein [Candidatus Saccharibacteria bacterium]
MGKNDVAPARSAGEQEAGSQPGKELHFDSKKIDQKQKPEYFVKVEGAEERKKAVVRKLKEQKEQLAKQAKQNKRDAKLEAFKQAHRSRFAKIKSAVGNFLKKHKLPLLIIAVALLVALAGWMVYRALNPPLTEDERSVVESLDRVSSLDADSFREELSSREKDENGSFQAALRWGEEQAESTDDQHTKFIYYYILTNHVLSDENYYDKALEYGGKLEALAQDDGEKYLAYNMLASTYRQLNNLDQYRLYRDKAAECTRNDAFKIVTEGVL